MNQNTIHMKNMTQITINITLTIINWTFGR